MNCYFFAPQGGSIFHPSNRVPQRNVKKLLPRNCVRGFTLCLIYAVIYIFSNTDNGFQKLIVWKEQPDELSVEKLEQSVEILKQSAEDEYKGTIHFCEDCLQWVAYLNLFTDYVKPDQSGTDTLKVSNA